MSRSGLRSGTDHRVYIMPSVDFDDLWMARPPPTQIDGEDAGGTFSAPSDERSLGQTCTESSLDPGRHSSSLHVPPDETHHAREVPRGRKRKASTTGAAMSTNAMEELIQCLQPLDYKQPIKPEPTNMMLKKRNDRITSMARNNRPNVRCQQVTKKMRAALLNAIHLDVDATKFLSTKTGWQGPSSSQTQLDIQSVLKHYLEVMKYTLIEPEPGETIPFLDRRRAIISLIILKDDEKWRRLMLSGNGLIDVVASRFRVHEEDKGNRRGDYNCHHFGISMGQGPLEPHNLRPRDQLNHQLVMELMNTETFKIIVGMVDDFFKIYARKLYDHYKEVLDKIMKRLPHLKQNHSKVFAAATMNLGPQTVTKPHYDSMNLAYGLCAIIVFGVFDADKGGFLVIKELGIVIRVRSGSIIFLPSAVVQHYNIVIQGSETRYSLTLYSAASLFRWVHNGFKTNTQLDAMPMSEQLKAQRKADDSMRMEKGMGLFNIVDP